MSNLVVNVDVRAHDPVGIRLAHVALGRLLELFGIELLLQRCDARLLACELVARMSMYGGGGALVISADAAFTGLRIEVQQKGPLALQLPEAVADVGDGMLDIGERQLGLGLIRGLLQEHREQEGCELTIDVPRRCVVVTVPILRACAPLFPSRDDIASDVRRSQAR